MIKIVTVGKRHESWIQDGIERYEKRLRAPWNVEWVQLPHSPLEAEMARQEESERILNKLDGRDYAVLLDETGQQMDSLQLSGKLEDCFTGGKSVVMIIGGAYGVSPKLQQRADLVWSLSKLVFPHQMVRLILIEQLYRAQSIANDHGYHHQ